MTEVLWRFLWIAILTIVVAYATYLLLGSFLHADQDVSKRKVVADDVVSPGEHHISGMIVVPSDCHGLSVHVEQTTLSSYQLSFQTWQEPYRDCPGEPTPRAFHAVTFAPSVGATFTATLDGQPFPLELIEQYPKKNP